MQDGWSVYWRIHFPFLIYLGYIFLVVAAVWGPKGQHLLNSTFPKIPNFEHSSLLISIATLLVLFGLSVPLIRKALHVLTKRFDCEFYERQFGIFSSLEKLNQGIFAVLMATGLMWFFQGKEFLEKVIQYKLWISLALLLFVGIMIFSVALYGWLTKQLDDLQMEEDHG